jgi:hypothetical protein
MPAAAHANEMVAAGDFLFAAKGDFSPNFAGYNNSNE